MVTELTEENFEKMTRQGNVVIDLYADWCAPCKMMAPVFEKLSKEFKDINFFKANVDNNQQAASIHAVRSIPTTLFLKDGKEVNRVIGLIQEEEFKEKIKETFE